mmetsp:Transcript_34250/g.75204  ORF Transcript_34250/g.75204 Transcript_34250/m.75204 type:complete len:393 (-) Transcript_34250:1538-2716(-)
MLLHPRPQLSCLLAREATGTEPRPRLTGSFLQFTCITSTSITRSTSSTSSTTSTMIIIIRQRVRGDLGVVALSNVVATQPHEKEAEREATRACQTRFGCDRCFADVCSVRRSERVVKQGSPRRGHSRRDAQALPVTRTHLLHVRVEPFDVGADEARELWQRNRRRRGGSGGARGGCIGGAGSGSAGPCTVAVGGCRVAGASIQREAVREGFGRRRQDERACCDRVRVARHRLSGTSLWKEHDGRNLLGPEHFDSSLAEQSLVKLVVVNVKRAYAHVGAEAELSKPRPLAVQLVCGRVLRARVEEQRARAVGDARLKYRVGQVRSHDFLHVGLSIERLGLCALGPRVEARRAPAPTRADQLVALEAEPRAMRRVERADFGKRECTGRELDLAQ